MRVTKLSTVLEAFRNYQKEIQQYEQARNLLQWDLRARTPKEGVESKVESIRFFQAKIFQMKTSEEYGGYLKKLAEPEEFKSLDGPMQLTVKRYLKKYEQFKRVPSDFYSSYVKMQSMAEKKWEEAVKQNDYSIFEPWLIRNIEMTTEYMGYMEPDMEVYDALLNQWEEGLSCEEIEALFKTLKEGINPLLKELTSREKPDLTSMEGTYDVDAQKKVQDLLLQYIGFDFSRGTTGESAHAITTEISEGDVRVTNHFYPENPTSSMFSAIHEGGHAIYVQNIAKELRNTAAGEMGFMDLHESQSRFYENILGRNINFWKPIHGKIGELLPPLQKVDLEVFHQAINYVHYSEKRTQADEVTYCLHIILRFEMEKAIFKDHIDLSKLKELWNQKTREYLTFTPKDDASGILQDLHWSTIYWGYFPTYLLGSIYDGMLLCQLEQELGQVDEILAEGRILEITHWLNEKIHQYGSTYNAVETMERVCHSKVCAKPLLDYFYRKK